jgi:hypothetical protein
MSQKQIAPDTVVKSDLTQIDMTLDQSQKMSETGTDELTSPAHRCDEVLSQYKERYDALTPQKRLKQLKAISKKR